MDLLSFIEEFFLLVIDVKQENLNENIEKIFKLSKQLLSLESCLLRFTDNFKELEIIYSEKGSVLHLKKEETENFLRKIVVNYTEHLQKEKQVFFSTENLKEELLQEKLFLKSLGFTKIAMLSLGKNGKKEFLVCFLLGSTKWQEKEQRLIKLLGLMLQRMELKCIRERELDFAIEQAQKESFLKSQFLANMSHEIRTPMSSIMGFTKLLENMNLNFEQEKVVNFIQSSMKSLMTVVNDVLDISKIEAGKAKLKKCDFDLSLALEEIFFSFKIRAQEKNLKFFLEIDNEIPKVLNGDIDRLKQILINLAHNALKFTKKGEIKIKASMEKESEDNIELAFLVQDTGIGIEEEKLGKIFERFEQVENIDKLDVRGKEQQGSGLGLVIVKNLTELMNGQITVTSELGKGTSFCVILPFEKSIQKEMLIFDEKLQNFHLNKSVKILLVEDNELNAQFFKRLLQFQSLDCDWVLNGKEAVDACLQNSYDIVFMDCQMPVMSGYEATKLIRENEEKDFNNKKRVIIVAMTAHAMKGDKEKCLACGMDDYLSKPAETEKIFKVIKEYVFKDQEIKGKELTLKDVQSKKILNREITQDKKNLAQRLAKTNGFDYEMSLEIVEEALPVLNKMLFSVEKSLRDGKMQESLNLLHKLKGACSNIRMQEIAEKIIKAENLGKLRKIDEMTDYLAEIRLMIEAYE